MKLTEQIPKYIVLAVIVGGLAIPAWNFFGADSGGTTVNVSVPSLSPVALSGKAIFDANCAACHGDNASGTEQGPPLIHNIYNPGHHGDESFLLAARQGVRQHHWPFGNMPPVEGVTDGDVKMIIAYVRELQRANGIN